MCNSILVLRPHTLQARRSPAYPAAMPATIQMAPSVFKVMPTPASTVRIITGFNLIPVCLRTPLVAPKFLFRTAANRSAAHIRAIRSIRERVSRRTQEEVRIVEAPTPTVHLTYDLPWEVNM